jgi:chromate reductase
VYDGLKAIPPYDEDDEAAGHEAVDALRAAIEDADAVLVSTPDNHSLPGQLKNALDWISRPITESPLRAKPAAVVGASTGLFGAVWAQAE